MLQITQADCIRVDWCGGVLTHWLMLQYYWLAATRFDGHAWSLAISALVAVLIKIIWPPN
jgi:hypothetical protein